MSGGRSPSPMKVLAAPDKFRGTATATEVADAVCGAAKVAGWDCTTIPMADGGEGTVRAMLRGGGGKWVRQTVTGPLEDMRIEAGFGWIDEGKSYPRLWWELIPEN